MDLLKDISIGVIDDSVREGAASYILSTILRIPLTVEVIHLEAPLFFRFELIECCFEIATVGTVRCEVLDKLKAGVILFELVIDLFVAYEVGVRHVPLLATG